MAEGFSFNARGLSRREALAVAATLACKPCCFGSGSEGIGSPPGSRPVCVYCPEQKAARHIDVALEFAGSCADMVNADGIVGCPPFCGTVTSITNDVASCFGNFTNRYSWDSTLGRYVPAIRCVTACQFTATYSVDLLGPGLYRFTLMLFFSDAHMQPGLFGCPVSVPIYFGMAMESSDGMGGWLSLLSAGAACVPSGGNLPGSDPDGRQLVCGDPNANPYSGPALLGGNSFPICINVWPTQSAAAPRNFALSSACPGTTILYNTPGVDVPDNCPAGAPTFFSGDCCRYTSVRLTMTNG